MLILSWEYPPIVAGGLARHVHKLAEALVGTGVEVHVLTRGVRGDASGEERAGVRVHRVPEDEMPPHEEPPYDRDRQLPRAHTGAEPDESDELM